MSSGGGSTQTQSTELPAWLQDAAKSNLGRADLVSKIGYVPQYGIDVAGFTPMQQSAMQNTANAASAFGLSAPTDAMAGMPAQQTNNLGFSGYSSGDLFNNYLSNLQAQRPAQYDAINSMFIDPTAGGMSTIFTPEGSVGTNDLADLNVNKFIDSGSGDFNGVQPTMSEWDKLMAANNFNQGVKDYPWYMPLGFAAKGLSWLNDKAVIDPYQAQHQVELKQYANGGQSSTGDYGYVSGDYGGNTITYGTADANGMNSAGQTAGGTGRTDGGWGW
jgi:hypothetical protein